MSTVAANQLSSNIERHPISPEKDDSAIEKFVGEASKCMISSGCLPPAALVNPLKRHRKRPTSAATLTAAVHMMSLCAVFFLHEWKYHRKSQKKVALGFGVLQNTDSQKFILHNCGFSSYPQKCTPPLSPPRSGASYVVHSMVFCLITRRLTEQSSRSADQGSNLRKRCP
jgi:hypothetical protein